ncbi:nucleotide exchange factor GrpE [Enterobacteriaceae endosymbiont of Donacia clavipes]|uniref:nucleotide exchange factor GrpE n=1 Tax=Enterobacteriaceae endosymbiont of Donacia clavipes TaxID=2675775 RepID=UPI001449F572|nr:nucleotide exchange factor GrpE [Enterobacteriaceae endosymbiont of Donacia clavipes]QJC33446.1 nucleotide exchange factor GrpE [Enterobacteriaceae endosymbiont of Donacia clavipes]
MNNNKSLKKIEEKKIEEKKIEEKKIEEKKIEENINNKLNNFKLNDNIKNKDYIKSENQHTIKYYKEKNDKYKLEILEIKNKLKKYKNDIWELKLRSLSEIENTRRRSALDVEKAYKFSLKKILHELLPVIDNLERAINLTTKTKDNVKLSIIEGIKLTLKSLLVLIKKFGVNIIDEINIPFNPSQHQAMSLVESNKIKNNYIIEILQKGYILNKRLLRPAMVVVSKNKEDKKNI